MCKNNYNKDQKTQKEWVKLGFCPWILGYVFGIVYDSFSFVSSSADLRRAVHGPMNCFTNRIYPNLRLHKAWDGLKHSAILRSSSIISFIHKCHSGPLNFPHIIHHRVPLLRGATAISPWTAMPGHPNESRVDQGPNSCSWAFKVYMENIGKRWINRFMRLLIALYKSRGLTCINFIPSNLVRRCFKLV